MWSIDQVDNAYIATSDLFLLVTASMYNRVSIASYKLLNASIFENQRRDLSYKYQFEGVFSSYAQALSKS